MGRRSIHLVCACAMLVATATSVVKAQSPEETAMAQQVAGSIKQSGQLSNYRLGVKYQDGVAWLLGSVANDQQQQAAIRLAQNVDGVEQVISKLQVIDQQESLVSPSAQLAVAPAPEVPVAKATKAAESIELTSAAPPVAAPSKTILPRMAQRPAARQMPRPMTMNQASAIRTAGQQGRPMPASYCGPGGAAGYGGGAGMGPLPQGHVPGGGSVGVSYDNAHMPGYAWPSYAAYPNYSAVTYPKQYSPTAWPYIGPFYPYPQVPLGWRKVCLEWDDGWWMLDFSHCKTQ